MAAAKAMSERLVAARTSEADDQGSDNDADSTVQADDPTAAAKEQSGPEYLQSLARGISVLSVLGEGGPRGLTLSEAAAATGVEQPILAVDGKTARRSHDRKNGLGALHSVSVWASEFGLSLGQVACAEKSHELTAIPEVLRLVDIKGAIITIDAMGTQKAIAETIIRTILVFTGEMSHQTSNMAANASMAPRDPALINTRNTGPRLSQANTLISFDSAVVAISHTNGTMAASPMAK